MFFSAAELSPGRPFHADLVGTVKVFAVGDTGMGKSCTLQYLHKHYGAMGKIIDGPQTTSAGLTAGLLQTNEGYKISFGAFALMNRRMVGIEELSGMKPEVLETAKETLSSGIIKVTKVQSTRDVPANVRLAVTSNFIDDKKVRVNSTQQIGKLLTLFKGASVIRRFDIGMVVGGIKNTTPTPTAHTLTKELCARHLKWAWSLRNVEFTPEAVDAIQLAEVMQVEKYDSTLGLVTSGDQSNKLARLSAALANLLFAKVVTVAHVRVIVRLMDRLYCSDTMAYGKYTVENADKPIDMVAYREVQAIRGYGATISQLLKGGSVPFNAVDRVSYGLGTSLWNKLLDSNLVRQCNTERGELQIELTDAGTQQLINDRPEYLERTK